MRANRVTLVLAVTATLALAGPSAWAQHRGGGRGGSGHRGGGYGYAVPRGGGGQGGGAALRHPRAGTGGYYGYGRHGGYYGHGHGYYGRYGYGYYRPYYYGGYYGYPYLSASLYFGFGGPYYSGWPYWGGYYGGPAYDSPTYVYGSDERAAPPRERARSDEPDHGDSGRVRLEVRPDDASIYVDNEFRGNGRAKKYLSLSPGRHTIELVRPGYAVVRREVEVVPGQTSDVLVELDRP